MTFPLYTDSLEKILEENSVQINTTFTAQCRPEKIMKAFIKDIEFFIVHSKKKFSSKYLKAVDDTIFKNVCINFKKINIVNRKEKITG